MIVVTIEKRVLVVRVVLEFATAIAGIQALRDANEWHERERGDDLPSVVAEELLFFPLLPSKRGIARVTSNKEEVRFKISQTFSEHLADRYEVQRVVLARLWHEITNEPLELALRHDLSHRKCFWLRSKLGRLDRGKKVEKKLKKAKSENWVQKVGKKLKSGKVKKWV